jgi:hypothetical protein
VAPDAKAAVLLEFLDAEGTLIRSYTRKPAGYDKWDDKQKSMDSGPWLPLQEGMNRFVWNLRHVGATRVPGNKTAGEASEGPYVLPGRYQVRLTIGDVQTTVAFEVVNDPRVAVDGEALREQQELLFAIRDKISEVHKGVIRLRALRGQVEGWRTRAEAQQAFAEASAGFLAHLAVIEDRLYLPGDQKMTYGLIVKSRLNQALATTIPVIASADARPTVQVRELVQHYVDQIDVELASLAQLIDTEVPVLNRLIQEAGLPAIG